MNWCFWVVIVGEDSWDPLDCKEIQPVHPKGDQSWIVIGRTDAKAETPILWPPDGKNWLTGKDPDARKDWKQEEKGTTEDEMVGWHHRLKGHESEQAPGVGAGQGNLVCCSPWGRKESHTNEWLNWTELKLYTWNEHNVNYTSIQMILKKKVKSFFKWIGVNSWVLFISFIIMPPFLNTIISFSLISCQYWQSFILWLYSLLFA